jgi:hypothetical protein
MIAHLCHINKALRIIFSHLVILTRGGLRSCSYSIAEYKIGLHPLGPTPFLPTFNETPIYSLHLDFLRITSSDFHIFRFLVLLSKQSGQLDGY